MSENWTPKWSALSQAEMSGCPQFKTEVSENLESECLNWFIMKDMLNPEDSEFCL